MGIDPKKFEVSRRRVVDHAVKYEKLDPETFFVLRHRDIAGVAALRAYAQALLLVLDVDQTIGPDGRDEILDLVDGVSAMADKWMAEVRGERHLPD